MQEAHVVLGAFGAGEKAGRVVPHKVYQGLASGRAVVTGDGEGVREFYEPGEHLLVVPRGDAGALTDALARVVADEALRGELGEAGRARTLAFATPGHIGRLLHEAVEKRRSA
jgi:glycosyltransferase involved in cell wall biosynthesis